MAETLREEDEEVPVTLGFGVGDLANNRGQRLRVIAEHLDYAGIQVNLHHIAWSQNPLDTAVLPFLGGITKWLAHKPVVVLDFGLPTIPTVQDSSSRMIRNEERITLISEDEVAEFVEEALAHQLRFGMLGAFWKSFGDFHPSIWTWPPFDMNLEERFNGIIRHDRSHKPAAVAFKSAATESPEAEPSTDWLDMTEEDFYKNPQASLYRLYGRFRECHRLE